MPFKIRSSKYRHVYGNPHKEDVCYKNIKITKNAAHDSAFCAVNPKFVAVVTEECGGGAFVVIPIKQTGRIDINMPKVSGHRGPVLDLKWNPFNDNEIASCSEDTTIKVWQIGDHGLYENLNEWVVDLHGHQRKVGQIEWHPTAENIMLSSGADYQVILWNLEKAEPIRIITCHNDAIQSINWNRDGSFFATTCKDKKLRIIDPRSGAVIAEGDGHQGSKISKVIILNCGTKLFTTGFSKLSERQIALWNIKDLSKPIQMEVVDCSSGLLIPYYDPDTKIVFVAGKGDGNIRYYEITDTEPYIHYLSEYKSSAPQRGLGFMPKRGLDVTKNEIFRFYKLHATGGICEPISMIVPRKSEVFQEDIYPDALSGIPSLSCDEWLMGENRDPILVSMKDGAVPFMPKIITYKQLGLADLGNNYSRSYLSNCKPLNGSRCNTLTKSQRNGIICLTNENNSSSVMLNGSPTTNKSSSSHLNNYINTNNEINFRNSNGLTNDINGNTRLVQSSRSAFNKMSSTSSHTSSPQSSPNQNINSKYQRYNSDTANEIDDNMMTSLSNSSCNGNGTVNGNGLNRASSNESLNQSQDDNYNSNFKSMSSSDKFQNNELETTYVTSVSKNSITLRKTESLKIDTVPSISRNRFDRMNSANLNSLTRNPLTRFQNHSIDESTNLNDSSEPLPPPNIVLSPLSFGQNKPAMPTPLLITANNTNSVNGYHGNTNGNNISCVKKRVWTPVQSNSNLKSNDILSGTQNTNLAELQKSYFRVVEEKNALKEQLAIQEKKYKQLEEELSNKDKRINSLENKLNLLMVDSNDIFTNDTTDC